MELLGNLNFKTRNNRLNLSDDRDVGTWGPAGTRFPGKFPGTGPLENNKPMMNKSIVLPVVQTI